MKLALGTVQFGMDYGIQGSRRPVYREIDEMLAYAIEHGIENFDSAAAYGNAENVIGHFVRHNREMSKNIHVISKLSPNILKETDRASWKDAVRTSAENSIRTLGIEKLEAFLFHDASCIFDQAAVDTLFEAVNLGLANKAGVSVYTPDEAMKALEYDAVKVIQIPYNIFDRRLDRCGFFSKARARGIEVYARSTLLQGLLMMKPGQLPAHMKFAEKYLTEFINICGEYETDPLHTAVGYVLMHDGIDYMVFGADNKEQLAEYIEIQNAVISQAVRETIDSEFSFVEERLVNPVLWGS